MTTPLQQNESIGQLILMVGEENLDAFMDSLDDDVVEALRDGIAQQRLP